MQDLVKDELQTSLYTTVHRLHRLKGYCHYSMKMTMSKSYFETLSQANRVADDLQMKVEAFFVNDGYKQTPNVTAQTNDIAFSIYDLIECAQQAMWLIVTSEPENKFGKKAVLDIMPFRLLIDSMRLSLRNIVKTQIGSSALVTGLGSTVILAFSHLLKFRFNCIILKVL